MPSSTSKDEQNEKKKPKMDRITVSLDEFDYSVVEQMAKNRNLSLSEVMRNIVHNWIEYNPEILMRNYGVNVEEITREIVAESIEISIEEIINKLPQFFEMVEDVSLVDLADYFKVSKKVIKKLIFEFSDKIKEVGLNLKYRGDRIYKI
ncbi:MAG: ribbon-helix-helix protein, CopG family [Candidatus Lokiarchaeota archaeon]|nr:ribbon-helix-helix protein, CopG family [Candidatus Lokiarchaeota archaeon]MBD3201197.1 ribbon-helix-helix protein, CopG family [Candidatus Lokiarchaeota archaeon]